MRCAVVADAGPKHKRYFWQEQRDCRKSACEPR